MGIHLRAQRQHLDTEYVAPTLASSKRSRKRIVAPQKKKRRQKRADDDSQREKGESGPEGKRKERSLKRVADRLGAPWGVTGEIFRCWQKLTEKRSTTQTEGRCSSAATKKGKGGP